MPNHPTPEDRRRRPFLGKESWDQINKDEAKQAAKQAAKKGSKK
jgi:hypothetical protein